MSYSTENKLPIIWIGGGALAYLSLGPVALAGVGVMWWSRRCKAEAISKGWMVDDNPTAIAPAPDITAALPAAIGTQTRLTAVDVPATPVNHEPTMPPPVTVNANPEIHNHIGSEGQSDRPIPTSASPAQADRQTEAPDLSLYPDVRERMTVLLKAMAAAGFPLGRLLKHPFVWCYGRSQSGKTTIAMMLSAARIAMGNRVEYLSTDEDVEPLAWASVSLGSDYYASGVDRVTGMMNRSTKGGLVGQGWVFDEMLAAAGQYKIDITGLLTAVLMKGSKTKAMVIGISQADTSGAHGLKGIDAAWREERISVEAIPTEDDLGERSPSGRYIVTQGNSSEEWTLPEWMLTELNKYGGPCPVVWILKNFPELRGQVQPGSTDGSAVVQSGFSGSDFGLALNPGSEAVQGLNPRESGSFSDLPLPGSEVRTLPEPRLNAAEPPSVFTNLNLNRDEAIARISSLQDAGMNQQQIILSLWGAKKGGSRAYSEATAQFKSLMG